MTMSAVKRIFMNYSTINTYARDTVFPPAASSFLISDSLKVYGLLGVTDLTISSLIEEISLKISPANKLLKLGN